MEDIIISSTDYPTVNYKLKFMLGQHVNIIIFTDYENPFNCFSIQESELSQELQSENFRKIKLLKISIDWAFEYKNKGTVNDCLKILFRNLPLLHYLILSVKYVHGLFVPMRFRNFPKSLRKLYIIHNSLLMEGSRLPYGCEAFGNKLIKKPI